MAELTYFDVTGTWEPSSPDGVINGAVAFTMLVDNNGVLSAPTLDIPAVVVPIVVPSSIDNNKLGPVSLLANTGPLNLSGTLTYRADFTGVSYKAPGEEAVELPLPSITFAASSDTTPINLVFVTPVAGSPVTQTVLPSTLVAYITDATTLGRELLQAADAEAAKSVLDVIDAPGALSTRETPVGAVDGARTTFTLAHTPISGTEVLTYNGLEQTAGGVDYTISGSTITFVTAPLSGALLCSYWYG